MQKLSRTDKYRDYRNKLNNGGEREIATKELKDLQDKIIFNEKRFGDSSKTESDLNKGKRDAAYENIFANLNRSAKNQNTDYNDIFNELNKYKNNTENQDTEEKDELDDYIKKIRDIVYKSDSQDDNSMMQQNVERIEDLGEFEKILIKNNAFNEEKTETQPVSIEKDLPTFKHELLSRRAASTEERIDQLEKEISSEEDNTVEKEIKEKVVLPDEEKPVLESLPSFEEVINSQPQETTQNLSATQSNKVIEDNFLDQIKNQIEKKEPQPQEHKEEKIAEFVQEKPVVELPKSQLENVQVIKTDIQPTIPKRDNSKEFEEICMNANSLAEEIDAADSFGKDQYVPPVSTSKPENSFEGIKQNVKKDLIGTENTDTYFDNLEKKLKEQNIAASNAVHEKKPEEKKIVVKSEVSEETKEQFENTVSLQVNKLISEINSSKSDNISATEIIKDNDKAKKEINDQPGKTIAFEVEKEKPKPDNTIVLTKPEVEDASIKTMSFKTEDLEIEDTGKGNTVLNIILSILIVIAVGALGVIIYFFLITRGII